MMPCQFTGAAPVPVALNRSEEGCTVLYFSQSTKQCMVLLQAYTPLHMAVGYSHTATVQALLGFDTAPQKENE